MTVNILGRAFVKKGPLVLKHNESALPLFTQALGCFLSFYVKLKD